MPLYEYQCQPCDTTFADLQPMDADPAATRCPDCDRPVQRLFSAFAPSVAGGAAPAAPPAGACGMPSRGCGQGACGM